MKDLAHRLITGGAVVMILTALTSVLSYVLRIFYSHTLSIEEYGLFFAMVNLSGAIILYSDLGFTYSASYLIPKFVLKKDYIKTWNTYRYSQVVGVGSTLVISIILSLFAYQIANDYFKVPSSQILVYVFCIYLIANSFVNTQHALLVGLQQEKYYSSILGVRMFLTIFLTLLFWGIWGTDITSFAVIATLSYVICSLLFGFLINNKNPFLKNIKTAWDAALFKQMFVYALPTLLASSVYSLIIFSDTFFLTLFRGLDDVGIYNVALPLASIPLIILSPFANFLFPLISHLMEKNRKDMSVIMDLILRIIPFFTLYFALFISMFPSQPVLLLFGEKWLGPTQLPLSILSIAYIPATLSLFYTTVVMGLGNAPQRLKALIVVAILSFGLNAPFVYYFGVVGAAAASCVIHLASVIFLGQIIKSKIPFNYPYRLYTLLLVFSVVFYSLVRFAGFEPRGWILYIISGIVYTVIMFLVANYLQLFKPSYFRLLLNNYRNEQDK